MIWTKIAIVKKATDDQKKIGVDIHYTRQDKILLPNKISLWPIFRKYQWYKKKEELARFNLLPKASQKLICWLKRIDRCISE